MSPTREDEENTPEDSRQAKLAALRDAGIPPYPNSCQRDTSLKLLQDEMKDLPSDEVTERTVSVVGRISSIRNSGMFIDINDGTDKVQVFHNIKKVEEHVTFLLSNLDIGDCIGVTGIVRRTKRGELTVNGNSLSLLSKAVIAPPEKYHGLTDIENRYRKREADLIANADSRNILRTRFAMVSKIRSFMADQGFMEVETPILQPIYGGAVARPFITHHNTLDLDLYLRIAPELYLKRLLVGGLSDKIFEMNRSFRNEGISTRHNPEFTMLEAYQAYADVSDMMELVEGIVCSALGAEDLVVKGNGEDITFTRPFRKLSMTGSVSDLLGRNVLDMDASELRNLAQNRYESADLANMSWGDLVAYVYEEEIEKGIVQPTHVMDFPAEISPLAKQSESDPRVADRFETICNGMEIANAFSEQNDPHLQEQIFADQVEQTKNSVEGLKEVDYNYIEALKLGLPPSGGLGVGIDRLAMLVTEVQSIREVIAFPTMRPVRPKS